MPAAAGLKVPTGTCDYLYSLFATHKRSHGAN